MQGLFLRSCLVTGKDEVIPKVCSFSSKRKRFGTVSVMESDLKVPLPEPVKGSCIFIASVQKEFWRHSTDPHYFPDQVNSRPGGVDICREVLRN